MGGSNKWMPLGLVVVLGLVVQALLIFADCQSTPNRVAVQFAKEYFKFDPDMAELICEERLILDDVNAVDAYLFNARQRAETRGFEISYLKNHLYNIETDTIYRDEGSAEVHLKATRRNAINPVYFWVGKLFGLTEARHVEATIRLIQENGRWKVCDGLFELPEAV